MEKLLSLDIQDDLMNTIDVSGFFAISEVHAIFRENSPEMDNYYEIYPLVDLRIDISVRIDRFRTIHTLDLALRELVDDGYRSMNITRRRARRPNTIDLVDPLEYIPYGALDLRRDRIIRKKNTYADLYRRSLPRSLMMRRRYQNTKKYLHTKKKPIYVAITSFFVITIPLLFSVRYSIEHSIQILASIPHSTSLVDVKEKIAIARADLERAEFLFLPFSWIPLESVDIVNRGVDGGGRLVASIDDILDTLPNSTGALQISVTEQPPTSAYRGIAKDISFGDAIGLMAPTDWIKNNQNVISAGIMNLMHSGEIFAGVRGDSKYANKMREIGDAITTMRPFLEGYEAHHDVILRMLGSSDPQRYIVFNQNRDEIRTNGGFPGSIITFTIYKGNILDYRSDDVYYYDWNLYPHQETPPPGIALLTNNYGLRDVNYYPDFLTTLDRANRFVERSGDSTLTTGIAINQGLIEDMLAVTGPVNVSGVTMPFDTENFSLLMSILVENQFARDKTPKDILFTFIHAFGEEIRQSGKYREILQVLRKNWENGEILMASRDDQIESFLRSIQKPLPWETDDKNWIYPVFTSVSGNKSDRYIDRDIRITTENIGACTYQNTVTLTETHTYGSGDLALVNQLMDTFGLANPTEREKMQFIQGNGENQSYIRYFVPQGAKLIGSGATEESDTGGANATVFSFELDAHVGGKVAKTLTYSLDIPDCTTYTGSVSVYRQPGLRVFTSETP